MEEGEEEGRYVHLGGASARFKETGTDFYAKG